MLVDTGYEKLMAEYLEYAPEGIDTRQGGIYYDAGAGFLFLLNRFYSDLNSLYDMLSLTGATGKYLDDYGRDYSVERLSATAAMYEFSTQGPMPDIGERFFADGLFFVLAAEGENVFLKAEESGSGGNSVAQGTLAVPVENVSGLDSLYFGRLARSGFDTQSDEKYRERIREKLSGPAENGNEQHYKTWCEQIDGVGTARIIPLDNGINSVTGVILDNEGKAAAASVIKAVQEYIDPNANGDGSGAANIGAVFKAVAPSVVEVKISFSVTAPAQGYTAAESERLAREAVAEYINGRNLSACGKGSYYLTAAAVGALIIMSGYAEDYSGLIMSARGTASESIEIGSKEYAVLA